MAATKEPATDNAPASVGAADNQQVDRLEKAIHKKNRELRNNYVALVDQLTEADDETEPKLKHELASIADEFIRLNSPYAASIVTKVARYTDDREELYYEALTTMWEHFLTWDPTKAQFTTYAYYSMVGDAQRSRVRSTDEGSYGDHLARTRVQAGTRDLREQLGRTPTAVEIGEYTKLPVDKVRRVMRATKVSLDKPVSNGESGSATLGDLIAQSAVPTTTDNLEDLWFSRLEQATKGLSIQDALIVIRRGGYDGWPAETLLQVGQWLGLGREPVRRAESRIAKRLEALGTPLPAMN